MGSWEGESLCTQQSGVVTAYLSLQLWKSLASRFPKVNEHIVGSLFTYFECAQAVCEAGTSFEGVPEISISILFSLWRHCIHKAGGYVSRLIYLFYFGLEKKKKKLSQLG